MIFQGTRPYLVHFSHAGRNSRSRVVIFTRGAFRRLQDNVKTITGRGNCMRNWWSTQQTQHREGGTLEGQLVAMRI